MSEKTNSERKTIPLDLRHKEGVEAKVPSSMHWFNFLPIPWITMTKNNSGRKGFILLPGYCPWWREASVGGQGRNSKQEPRRNTAYWFASSGLLSYDS